MLLVQLSSELFVGSFRISLMLPVLFVEGVEMVVFVLLWSLEGVVVLVVWFGVKV